MGYKFKKGVESQLKEKSCVVVVVTAPTAMGVVLVIEVPATR